MSSCPSLEYSLEQNLAITLHLAQHKAGCLLNIRYLSVMVWGFSNKAHTETKEIGLSEFVCNQLIINELQRVECYYAL